MWPRPVGGQEYASVKKWSNEREQFSYMYIYLHAQLMTHKKNSYLISRGNGVSLRRQTIKSWAGSTNEGKGGPGHIKWHKSIQDHSPAIQWHSGIGRVLC